MALSLFDSFDLGGGTSTPATSMGDAGSGGSIMDMFGTGNGSPLDYLTAGINGFLDYQRIVNGTDQTQVANAVQTPNAPNASIQPLVVMPSNPVPAVPTSPDLTQSVSVAGLTLPLWFLGGLAVFVAYRAAKGKG